ncbi:hypothetical protein [Methylobacterium gnaphalii]|uniref:Uncharacterized protein n=1 Tax=Methylobacterium gnaphalii TaxID=1010610 RepID=A0A512JMA2_9HYPH|nr:hypothetical protein [Methylobacterium gnaphalii]GEP11097.1 hypothetical protein MGN01_29420 [Methylobacterium gnaphalii]GJD67090.1 hypothetical protein MMMDOFMJ_0003 [Methylobacterium gnaphalii]GLS50375.1 hypothetical protein GCM10007885_32270 [Methylobacterium gnaphalii]
MPTMRDMLTPEVLAGMEKWMDGLVPVRSLPQAVNEALADWLTGQGTLPSSDCSEEERDQDRWA